MEINVLRTRFVEDAMSHQVETIPPDMPLAEVRDKILETGHQGFPLVNAQGQLIGIITGRDVAAALKAQPVEGKSLPAIEVANRSLIVAHPNETLDLVWERLRRNRIGHLPVVSRDDPDRLLGLITRGDLIRFRGKAP